MVLKSKTNTTNHIYSDSYRPCEALRRPVHHPPEHRHDAIGDVAPWLVAWRWYTIIEKNDTLLYKVTIQYKNKIGVIHRQRLNLPVCSRNNVWLFVSQCWFCLYSDGQLRYTKRHNALWYLSAGPQREICHGWTNKKWLEVSIYPHRFHCWLENSAAVSFNIWQWPSKRMTNDKMLSSDSEL